MGRYSIGFVFQISSFDLGDDFGRVLNRPFFGPVDQHSAQLKNVELGQSAVKHLPGSLNGYLKGTWGKKIRLFLAVKYPTKRAVEQQEQIEASE